MNCRAMASTSDLISCLFFDHILAAAHQGNATGVLRSRHTGAGFFHLQFQTADIADIQISFFHVRTICHGKPPLVSILLWLPTVAFSFRSTFFAIFCKFRQYEFPPCQSARDTFSIKGLCRRLNSPGLNSPSALNLTTSCLLYSVMALLSKPGLQQYCVIMMPKRLGRSNSV